ncbi:MAG: hypothetical protein JSR58_02905 [Verrucomicrobia bacterium]|nr:hypothetical protein [Verrucomicrobiota bacterium]
MTKVNTSFWTSFPSMPRISLPAGRYTVLAAGAVITGVAIVAIWHMVRGKMAHSAERKTFSGTKPPALDFYQKLKKALNQPCAPEEYPGNLAGSTFVKVSCEPTGVSLIGDKAAYYLHLSGKSKNSISPLGSNDPLNIISIDGLAKYWASTRNNCIYGIEGCADIKVPGQIVQVANGQEHIYVATSGNQVLIYPKSKEAQKGPSRTLTLNGEPIALMEYKQQSGIKDLFVVTTMGFQCYRNVNDPRSSGGSFTRWPNAYKGYAQMFVGKDDEPMLFWASDYKSDLRSCLDLKITKTFNEKSLKFPVFFRGTHFIAGEKGVYVDGSSLKGELSCQHPILGLSIVGDQLYAFGPNQFTKWDFSSPDHLVDKV